MTKSLFLLCTEIGTEAFFNNRKGYFKTVALEK